jgi:undecaprenyl-diphosphatase
MLKRNQFLTVLSVLQLALFGYLAWWAHKHPVDSADVAITRRLQKRRSLVLGAVSPVLSLTCAWQFMNVIAVPVAAVFWRARLRLEGVMFVGICVLCTMIRKQLQNIVDRPRPSPVLVHVEKHKSNKSFPSGHAATSVACWGWLLALGVLFMRGRSWWQKAILAVPALFIVLAGPSRVYLGEHWPSDVAGGYLYGGAWLSLALQVYFALKDKGVLAE